MCLLQDTQVAAIQQARVAAIQDSLVATGLGCCRVAGVVVVAAVRFVRGMWVFSLRFSRLGKAAAVFSTAFILSSIATSAQIAVELTLVCPSSAFVVSMSPIAVCTSVANVCLATWKWIFFVIPTFLAMRFNEVSTLGRAGRLKRRSPSRFGGSHDSAVGKMGITLSIFVFF